MDIENRTRPHNDHSLSKRPGPLKYDENWDFAELQVEASSKSQQKKKTLLQQAEELGFETDPTMSVGYEAICESNLREEMIKLDLSDKSSLSSQRGPNYGGHSPSSTLRNPPSHPMIVRGDVHSISGKRNDARGSDVSENGLADELFMPYGNRGGYGYDGSQSDIQSMYSAPSEYSEVRRGHYNRDRDGLPSTSRSRDQRRASKDHREDRRNSSKHCSRILQTTHWDNSPPPSKSSSRKSEVGRDAISERFKTGVPSNNNSPASIRDNYRYTDSGGRLSIGNQSATQNTSNGSERFGRASRQDSGRNYKVEIDSIGSASSIMLRSQSRLSKSSGTKSMTVTDPDDEILVGPEKNLHDAARKGDVEVVEQLLNDGVDIDCKSQTERTALHLAAGNGQIAVMKLMIERDASIECTDKFGMEALHWAAWFGHEEVVRLLLRAGAKPTSRNKNGYTFLHCAAQNNHRMIERVLIEDLEDFDINTPDDVGRTCLHVLVKHGRKSMLERFLTLRCNVNAQDKEGNTPLHLAAKYGFDELILVLIKGGANIDVKNAETKTPLHLAAEGGNAKAVEVLISEGADANAETEDELSPLHLAVGAGRDEAAIALINGGADVDAGNKHNQTPLHVAVLNRQPSIVQLLVFHDANPNTRDARQESPLHLAAENGHPDITEMLLRSSVNLTLTEQRGKTALDIAARGSFTTIVDMIIKAERHHVNQKTSHLYKAARNDQATDVSNMNLRDISFKPDDSPNTQQIRILLYKLATKYLKRDEWRKLAFYWSFTDYQVCAIEEQYTGEKSYREHGHRMLLIWLHGCLLQGGNPTKLLFEGLVAIQRQELAEMMRSKANSMGLERSCIIT